MYEVGAVGGLVSEWIDERMNEWLNEGMIASMYRVGGRKDGPGSSMWRGRATEGEGVVILGS